MLCDHCKKWHHIHCEGMEKSTYKALVSIIDNEQLHCNVKILGILNELNDDKSEFMLVGKKVNLSNLGDVSMTISGSEVNIVESVCDLGVLLDSTLTLKCQINNVVRIAGYHHRNIAFIKKYLGEESVKKLVINNIISRVDYCNSIYYNLPK